MQLMLEEQDWIVEQWRQLMAACMLRMSQRSGPEGHDAQFVAKVHVGAILACARRVAACASDPLTVETVAAKTMIDLTAAEAQAESSQTGLLVPVQIKPDPS